MDWKRALVTGGAGFIGSNIVKKINELGKEACVLDNLSVGTIENLPLDNKNIKFIRGDIRDKKILRKSMKNCDIIFHNAAFVSIRGSFTKMKKDLDNNCLGTLNVLEAAVKNDIKKLIFASSMAVYGEAKNLLVKETDNVNPISPYGLSKLRGEMYCRIFEERCGLKTISLRYFNTYGIGQAESSYVGVITTFINQILNNKPLTIFGDGKQTRDFVWVEDVAKANILAADSNVSNEIFNVASGTETSVNQIADMLLRINGSGTKMHTEAPGGEINRIVANVDKIKKKIGHISEGNLEKILPKIWKYWKNKKIK